MFVGPQGRSQSFAESKQYECYSIHLYLSIMVGVCAGFHLAAIFIFAVVKFILKTFLKCLSRLFMVLCVYDKKGNIGMSSVVLKK